MYCLLFYIVSCILLGVGGYSLEIPPENLLPRADSRVIVGKETLVCSNESLSLNCTRPHLRLVIQRALFIPQSKLFDGHHCRHNESVDSLPIRDIRLPLNTRCSGRTSCVFNLLEHTFNFPMQVQGAVEVAYDCVAEYHLKTKCNRVLKQPSGYVATPGYPEYYPPIDCTWTLRGKPGQSIHVLILDLHTRVESLLDEGTSQCVDVLRITENSKKLHSSCDILPEGPVPHIQSVDHSLNITFNTKDTYPRRGVLFFYTAIGCPTLTAPKHGYQVFRNSTHAEFLCCIRHVFPDTLKRHRLLYCEGRHHWNDTLPNCARAIDLYRIANDTAKTILAPYWNMSNTVTTVSSTQSDAFYDFILPVCTILVLMMGNSILVAAILTIRKRKEEDWKKKELEEAQDSSPSLV